MIFLLNKIISVISFVYSYKRSLNLERYKNVFYSLWIHASYNNLQNGHFQYPAIILGGNYVSIGERTYFDKHLE